jgi:hypothetical protein
MKPGRVFAMGLVAALLSLEATRAAEIEGVEFVERLSFRGTEFRLHGQIEQVNAIYHDVEPGDRYSLTYLPGVGTELALNGEPRGVIEGAEISAALFAIWIGRRPLDEPLREQLLRRS